MTGYFDAGYKVYIGPGKYFVTSDVGSGRIQWYAFLALPPGKPCSMPNGPCLFLANWLGCLVWLCCISELIEIDATLIFLDDF